MTCAVCEVNAADVEALLFPTLVDKLMPMFVAHSDDPDAWPSLALCDACAAITASTFNTLAEELSTAALCALTSDDLGLIVRLALTAEREATG